MANIKSAKKRVLVDRRNEEKNKAVRSASKTAVKKLYAAVESGDKVKAEAELKNASKTLEMAASKGVYHKNNVANKTSKMAKAVNKMA